MHPARFTPLPPVHLCETEASAGDPSPRPTAIMGGSGGRIRLSVVRPDEHFTLGHDSTKAWHQSEKVPVGLPINRATG